MLESNPRTKTLAAPDPADALALFRALPLGLALGLVAWASLAAVAYAVHLLAT